MRKRATKRTSGECAVGVHMSQQPAAALAASTDAIVRILSVANCGDEAKAQAMRTLRALAKAQPMTVSGCTFYGTDVGVVTRAGGR